MTEAAQGLSDLLVSLGEPVAGVVCSAVGSPDGLASLAGMPVLGFHHTATPALGVREPGSVVTGMWVVTPGRLIKVEVGYDQGLVITFPLERVSRVVESYVLDGYVLTIEVDAEARFLASPERQELTRYPLIARADDPLANVSLREFSRQLRLALGA